MRNKRILYIKLWSTYYFRIVVSIVFLTFYSSEFLFSKSTPVVNAKTDSLKKIIQHSGNDYLKAKAFVDLSEIIYLADIDSVIPLCNNAIIAIDKALKDLANSEKNDMLNVKASALNNIGYVFYNKGNIPKALDYYLQALKLREETGSKMGLAESLTNLGALYKNQGDANKAIEYYQKSLKLYKEAKNLEGQARLLGNIGVLYDSEKAYDKALEYYLSGLKLQDSIGNDQSLARVLNNIGIIYDRQNRTSEALKYCKKSLRLSTEIEDKQGMASALIIISQIEFNNNDFKKAREDASQSLKLSQELDFPVNIMNAAKLMYDISLRQNKWEEALKMHLLYTSTRDSLNNEELRKVAIQKEFQYEYDKKEAILKSEQEKERVIAAAKRKKQQLLLLFVVSVLIAISVIALIIYRSLQQSKTARNLIENQKEIIEIKNKEIIDSIYYARRIQRALLTSDNYIKNLIREYFILYKPKDIVSGDFYWVLNKNNCVYVVTADCTGHGVPGAFMSMMGINLLNDIINERNITDPAAALDFLRKEIIKNLNPEGATEEAKEGMDIVLCKFDFKNNLLEFAAANNALYLLRNGTLKEYKGDKMPVGKYSENTNSFTKRTIELKKGDIIYTFTDGYPDQFGGPNGKKYLYKKLENKLQNINHLPMSDQKGELLNEFEKWRGGLEQIDDVTVIGIKV